MDKPNWFAMDKCQMCAPMIAEKGLIDYWRFQDVPFATGMVQTSSVDKGYEEAYRRAGRGMDAVGQRLAQGERPYRCGHGTSLSGILKDGAMLENVEAQGRFLMFVSGTDPKLIKRIQAHAERTNSEMQKTQMRA